MRKTSHYCEAGLDPPTWRRAKGRCIKVELLSGAHPRQRTHHVKGGFLSAPRLHDYARTLSLPEASRVTCVGLSSHPECAPPWGHIPCCAGLRTHARQCRAASQTNLMACPKRWSLIGRSQRALPLSSGWSGCGRRFPSWSPVHVPLSPSIRISSCAVPSVYGIRTCPLRPTWRVTSLGRPRPVCHHGNENIRTFKYFQRRDS